LPYAYSDNLSRGNLSHFQNPITLLDYVQLLYALPLLKGLEF
jgi:hypothetical protein